MRRQRLQSLRHPRGADLASCVSALFNPVCRADGEVHLPQGAGGRLHHLATGERRTMVGGMGHLLGSTGSPLGSGEARHPKVRPAESMQSPGGNGCPIGVHSRSAG